MGMRMYLRRLQNLLLRYWRTRRNVIIVASVVVGVYLSFLAMVTRSPILIKINNSIPNNPSRFASDTREFSRSAVDRMKLFDLDCSYDYNVFAETTFVSAVSQNHFDESMRLFDSFKLRFPKSYLTLYDLGLDERYRKRLKQKYNFLHVVTFNFSKYPVHVKRLKNYSWKPLVIAEIISTRHSDVVWMDTSVNWKPLESAKHPEELLFECYPLRPHKSPICHGFPIKLFDPTGHSIISATHPDVYRYFIGDSDDLDLTDAAMFSANLIFIRRRPEVIRSVIYWWILCALEPNCIAPHNAQLKCESAETSKDVYRKCHRYDQSVLNVLLAKATQLNQTHYTLPNDFAAIKRGFVPK